MRPFFHESIMRFFFVLRATLVGKIFAVARLDAGL
jgi:hypothetical protein